MRKLSVLSVLTVALWAMSLSATPSRAAEDAESNAAINGIADLLEKGDVAAAKKAAAAAAKSQPDVETVMTAMKPRKNKGIGVGKSPGGITPDGIELKLNGLARDGITAAVLKKEGDALTRMGFVVQGLGLYTNANPPEMDMGKKKKADWVEWSDKMVKASEEFVAAAKSNSAADLKKAATNLKNSCDGCHAIFK